MTQIGARRRGPDQGHRDAEGQSDHSAFLRALAALVDERVELALAERGIAVDYTSASLPPGVTARTFARWCRSGRVDGVTRDGIGWRCSAHAWREARAGGPTRSTRPTLRLVPSDDAAALLAAAGMRPTRGR
jgi:hypothetical protein